MVWTGMLSRVIWSWSTASSLALLSHVHGLRIATQQQLSLLRSRHLVCTALEESSWLSPWPSTGVTSTLWCEDCRIGRDQVVLVHPYRKIDAKANAFSQLTIDLAHCASDKNFICISKVMNIAILAPGTVQREKPLLSTAPITLRSSIPPDGINPEVTLFHSVLQQ